VLDNNQIQEKLQTFTNYQCAGGSEDKGLCTKLNIKIYVKCEKLYISLSQATWLHFVAPARARLSAASFPAMPLCPGT